MTLNKKLFIPGVIGLSFLAAMFVLNFYSLENAKNACVENNRTPEVEQGFLSINWSVSCK
ncbi:hypothetical protein [Neobacillus sp. SAB-20_R2A]|uniref:hypothetical protein n=1 Tax=Neobacillus sp. SAB-20_R2A TaxID=3120519 RepID=UPI003C6E08C1